MGKGFYLSSWKWVDLSFLDDVGCLDVADDGLLGIAATTKGRLKKSIRHKRNHAPARPRHLPQVFTTFCQVLAFVYLTKSGPNLQLAGV